MIEVTTKQEQAIRDTLITASNLLREQVNHFIERGFELTAGLYATKLVKCERALAAVFGYDFDEPHTRIEVGFCKVCRLDSGTCTGEVPVQTAKCGVCDRVVDGVWYNSDHKCDECHGRGCDFVGEKCVYCHGVGLLVCWLCDGTGEVTLEGVR